MKRKSLTVVVCATLVALTFVLGWIPYGGPFLLPLLFAACCFSLGISFFASTMFGVVSYLLALMSGGGTFVGLFFLEHPYVPIVARMFIGPIAYFLHKLLTKLVNPKTEKGRILPISLTAAAGSFLNTFFVGIFLLTLKVSDLPTGMVPIGLAELVLFGAIEIVVNAILLPPIVLTVRRSMPRLMREMGGAPLLLPSKK